MDQHKKLWEGEYREGAPSIINFFKKQIFKEEE